MPLRIVHYNEPILRKKGAKAPVFDAALARFAGELIDTMHAAEGIGLAAQQVGRALQLCVVDLRAAKAAYSWELDGAQPPKDLFMPLVIANPEIKALPGEDEVFEEGCLSFPDIRGDVTRPGAITVKFQDEHGHPHTLTCDGLLARCIQHEADHLNGVLFIDRMDRRTRKQIDNDLLALEKQTSESPASRA